MEQERKADHAGGERIAREKRRREEGVKQRDTTWRHEVRKTRSASGPCTRPDSVLQIVQSDLGHLDFVLSIALRVVETEFLLLRARSLRCICDLRLGP
jgi:hypothetical protein